MKKYIIGIIIGGMIFGSIGVYAVELKYKAEEISYQDKTVQDSLNDLYDKSNKQIEYREGTFTFNYQDTKTITFSTPMEEVPTEVYIQPVNNISGHNYAIIPFSSNNFISITKEGFTVRSIGMSWSGTGGSNVVGTTATYNYIAIYKK